MNGYDVHNTNIDLIFSGLPRFFCYDFLGI